MEVPACATALLAADTSNLKPQIPRPSYEIPSANQGFISREAAALQLERWAAPLYYSRLES